MYLTHTSSAEIRPLPMNPAMNDRPAIEVGFRPCSRSVGHEETTMHSDTDDAERENDSVLSHVSSYFPSSPRVTDPVALIRNELKVIIDYIGITIAPERENELLRATLDFFAKTYCEGGYCKAFDGTSEHLVLIRREAIVALAALFPADLDRAMSEDTSLETKVLEALRAAIAAGNRSRLDPQAWELRLDSDDLTDDELERLPFVRIAVLKDFIAGQEEACDGPLGVARLVEASCSIEAGEDSSRN